MLRSERVYYDSDNQVKSKAVSLSAVLFSSLGSDALHPSPTGVVIQLTRRCDCSMHVIDQTGMQTGVFRFTGS
jgi:hypothetical protein